jgi:4-aminobutyrate aminotransferase/(S)-3-amino-2-methylpropionate transaminase
LIQEKLPVIVSENLPGPKSQELLARRRQYVARGISCGSEVFIEEARGALMKDVDGNVFLDFAAAIGVQNVGHCDPAVVEAVQRQAEKYIHPGFNIVMYEPYIALSERLAQMTPGTFHKKVMFINSGAEAVENAIKISRRYTKKIGIISLEYAFHGRTFMGMALTSKVIPYKNGFGPFGQEIYKIPSAYCYRCPIGSSYPGCGLACAEKLRTLLKGELSADNIACLIAEPVQGEGGFIVPPPEYLQALQSICKDNGIVFIVDEVQAGFGRTGKIFASENFNIEPDLLTLAKSIAAGLPLSAVVGKAEIMDAPNPGEIGGTFAGKPVACAAGLTVLDKLQQEDLAHKAQVIGTIIKNRLREMQERYDKIGDIRGLGAMIGVEFVKDRGTKEPHAELVKKIVAYAYQRGVLFLSAGMFENVLRFLPPLVMTEDQVGYGMDILDESIQYSLCP